MTGQLASRVKRARTTGGICLACCRTLVQGQHIAKVGNRWQHAQCVAGRKPPMIGWPTPAALGDTDDRPEQPGGSKEGTGT